MTLTSKFRLVSQTTPDHELTHNAEYSEQLKD